MDENKEFKQQFDEYLRCLSGTGINIAGEAYKLICKAEKPEKAFEYFLVHADEMEQEGEHFAQEIFTLSEMINYSKSDKLIDGLLDEVINRKLEAGEFYRTIWEKLNILFEDEKKRIYAFFRIWMDGRIPYYNLEEGITMSNEEFQEKIAKQKDNIKKAIFIMNMNYSQKTERSSLIIDILEKCDSDKDKAVVLSQAFSALERNVFNGLMEKLSKASIVKKDTGE